MDRGCWWNGIDSCCVSSEWLIMQWRKGRNIGGKIWLQVLSNVKNIFMGDILITVKYSFEKGPVDVSTARRHLWSRNSYVARSFSSEVNISATSKLLSWLNPSFQLFWCMAHCSLLAASLRCSEIAVDSISAPLIFLLIQSMVLNSAE